MELLEALNWRYAAKRMNGEAVPKEKMDNILEAIRLSASSAGMQPYKVIVVSGKEWKEKLYSVANNQPPVTEGSHLLVFASLTRITEEYIDEQIERIASIREVDMASLQPFTDKLKGFFLNITDEQLATWAARQAYIALGFGLVAAAMNGVDATPMEGFNSQEMDEHLGLKEKGLQSVLVMAIGYRDEANDFLANAKKVRQSREDLFIEMN